MYKEIKSCVTYNGEQSFFFSVGKLSSFRGVRQGENPFPLLFALFLNDLESFLCDISFNGVNFEFQ